MEKILRKKDSQIIAGTGFRKNGIDERGNETECVTTFRRSTTTCSDCKDIGFKSTRYFTDEPTGNLDEETAMFIMQILEDSVHQMNKCAVIVTHSNEIAKKADVVFQLKRGTLHIVENNEKV